MLTEIVNGVFAYQNDSALHSVSAEHNENAYTSIVFPVIAALGLVLASTCFFARRKFLSPLERLISLAESPNPDFEECQRLIDSGINVNFDTRLFCRHRNTSTPLHSAVMKGTPEMIEFLVNNGAWTNLLNQEFVTPLEMAISEGKIENAKKLISLGATCTPRSKWHYETPIKLAITASEKYGWDLEACKEIVRMFVEGGINLEESVSLAKGDEMKTPLVYASYHGSAQMLQALVELGATLQGKDGKYVVLNGASGLGALKNFQKIMAMIQEKQLRIPHKVIVHILSLCQSRTDGTQDEKQARMQWLMEWLPQNGYDLIGDGNFLYAAALYGCLEELKLLIQLGANVFQRAGQNNEIPLHASIKGGHFEIFQFLIAQDWKKVDNLLEHFKYACELLLCGLHHLNNQSPVDDKNVATYRKMLAHIIQVTNKKPLSEEEIKAKMDKWEKTYSERLRTFSDQDFG